MSPLAKLIDVSRFLLSKQAWKILAKHLGVSKTGLGKIGLGTSRDTAPLSDAISLGIFLQTRASHVTQTSLYGYLRTRAGTRYPELFEQPDILQSINMAKWQIWLACLSDLTVYVGGLIYQRSDATSADICVLLSAVVDTILKETGIPDEAAAEFQDTAESVRIRLANCDFSTITDNDVAFVKSPAALFYWAPIADELKNRDQEIVENSVRFRWQEIRRSTRKLLQAKALMAHSSSISTDHCGG